jgi:hypothetical protein
LAGLAWTTRATGGGVAAALVVEVSWALAMLQVTPRQIAVAVMAASAIRKSDGYFFILSIPPLWRGRVQFVFLTCKKRKPQTALWQGQFGLRQALRANLHHTIWTPETASEFTLDIAPPAEHILFCHATFTRLFKSGQ